MVQRLLQDVVTSCFLGCFLAVVVVFPALWPLYYVNLCEILELCARLSLIMIVPDQVEVVDVTSSAGSGVVSEQ